MQTIVLTTPHRPNLTAKFLTQYEQYVNPDWPLPEGQFRYHALNVYGRDNSLGQYRCFRGHQEISRNVTEDFALIMEDDAKVLDPKWCESLDNAEELLLLNTYNPEVYPYEVICLHVREAKYEQVQQFKTTIGAIYGVATKSKKQYPELRWGLGSSLAYLINKKAARKLANLKYDGMPIDITLLNKFSTACLVDSPFGHDRSNGSLVEKAV